MASIEVENAYRIKELERQLKGVQRRVAVIDARTTANNDKYDRRIRDLEIKNAARDGVTQRRIAEIYELSTGRVSQIVKKAC